MNEFPQTMRYLTVYILGLLILTTSCGQADKQDNQDTIVLYNDAQDSTLIKFNQAIMELPEFKTWEYNYRNSDTSKIIGYSNFENRKVITNSTIFYHIELFRQKFNKPTDSFINSKEIVCYFRVSPTDNNILILNTETEQFLDLTSEQGRQYFKNCLITVKKK